MKRLLYGIVLTVLMSISILIANVEVPRTYPSSARSNLLVGSTGWLAGWEWRKSHIINNATGAGIDYQICINVYYGSGQDGTETMEGVTVGKVYCSSHCKTDFGDIRFTASDGTTLLDYWIQSSTPSDKAVIWVRVSADLDSSNQTIYIYYGNANATTTSNGNNTFRFFEDFSEGSIDWTSKWRSTDQTLYSVEDGSLKCLAVPSNDGTRMIQTNETFTGFAAQALVRSPNTTQPSAAEAYALVSENTPGTYSGKEMAVLAWYFTPNSLFTYINGGGSYGIQTANNNWYKAVYTCPSSGAANMSWYDSSGALYSGSAAGIPYFSSNVHLGFLEFIESTVAYFKDIIVRKYVNPEPAHAGWGEEIYLTVARTPDLPNYDEDVTVSVAVIKSVVDQVILSYCFGMTWHNITMTSLDDVFNATIPRQPYGTMVQYTIYVQFTSGDWVASATYSYAIGDSRAPEVLAEWKASCPYPYVPSNLTRANEPVLVTANVTEPANASGVSKVFLSYRVDGSEWWNATMAYNSTTELWTMTIPGQSNTTNTVEFFMQAHDNAGNLNTTQTYSYQIKHLLLGDIDGNGRIDMSDINTVLDNFGKHYP